MAGRGTIVVGVDGSVDARRALDWAVVEAQSQRKLVLAVHAWTLGRMADFASQSRVMRRESVALLEATIRDVVRLGAEAELGWSSVEGDAATVVLCAVRNAELLVLAAHRGTAPVLRRHERTDVPTGEWLSSATRTA